MGQELEQLDQTLLPAAPLWGQRTAHFNEPQKRIRKELPTNFPFFAARSDIRYK